MQYVATAQMILNTQRYDILYNQYKNKNDEECRHTRVKAKDTVHLKQCK